MVNTPWHLKHSPQDTESDVIWGVAAAISLFVSVILTGWLVVQYITEKEDCNANTVTNQMPILP